MVVGSSHGRLSRSTTDRSIFITTNILSAKVRRLPVNNGSSYNILFLEVFSRKVTDPKGLRPCFRGLVGFTGHETPIT